MKICTEYDLNYSSSPSPDSSHSSISKLLIGNTSTRLVQYYLFHSALMLQVDG